MTIKIELSCFEVQYLIYILRYCHGVCYEMFGSSRSYRSLPAAHVHAHAHLALLSGNAVCMMETVMVRAHTRSVL